MRFAVALLLAVGAIVIGPAAAPIPAGAPSADAIMQEQRRLHRVRDEEEIESLQIYARSGAVKERKVVRYTLTTPEDLSKILVRFLAPRDVEHTGLLTWEARDGNDDQWLYLPAVRKTKRIATSAKKSRFMGTDFALEDLRPEGLALHTYTLVGTEVVDGQECHVIDALPASPRQAADSGYGRRRLFIRKDIHFTVRRDFYDRKGVLAKIGLERALVNVRGTVWRANEIEMRDVQAETRTVIVVEKRTVDRGLKESLFSEAELARALP